MCNITSGLEKICEYRSAGNSTFLYLANFDEVSATFGGTPSVVQTITGDFYRFEVEKDTLSSTSDLAKGANDNRYYDHRVAFKTSQSDAQTKETLEELGLSRVIAIVQDRAGKFKMFGFGLGLQGDVMSALSGLAAGDETGWSVELAESGFGHSYWNLAAGLEPTLGSGVYTFA
jgi:hypothetical protein